MEATLVLFDLFRSLETLSQVVNPSAVPTPKKSTQAASHHLGPGTRRPLLRMTDVRRHFGSQSPTSLQRRILNKNHLTPPDLHQWTRLLPNQLKVVISLTVTPTFLNGPGFFPSGPQSSSDIWPSPSISCMPWVIASSCAVRPSPNSFSSSFGFPLSANKKTEWPQQHVIKNLVSSGRHRLSGAHTSHAVGHDRLTCPAPIPNIVDMLQSLLSSCTCRLIAAATAFW